VRDAVAQHQEGLAQLSESDLRPVVLRDFQLAARAQKASVTPGDLTRYEAYNALHGARYVDPSEAQAMDGEEDW
jgi:Vps4 C terminal oligomerisation domain